MKKGFTLIETIVVLLILCIISILTIHITLRNSNKSDKTNLELCESYINNIENQIMKTRLDENLENDIEDGNYNIVDLSNKGIDTKEIFLSGNIYIKDGNIYNASIEINNTIFNIVNGEIITN